MPHHIQNTTSPTCFNPKQSGSDDSPASNNARSPTRSRKPLEGLPPLEVPTSPEEPRKSPRKPEKVVEVSQAAFRLARLKTLPPLSPEGRHFAISVREGDFTYADVTGEWLFQLLQDNLPGYENYAGEDKARSVRANIEKLHRGDPKEMRELLNLGFEFEPGSKWSTHEKSKVSKYPMALETTGVARGGSEFNWLPRVSKATKCSPESSQTQEKTVYSGNNAVESPISLSTSDMSDYESSECDSEEDGWASEDKPLDEMFPYQRFREP